METQEWFEQYKQKLQKLGYDEGVDEGRKLGRDEGRVQLFERRLGRSLSEAERKVLAERLERLGEGRLDEVVLDFRPEALLAWLADPTAR